MKAVRVEPAAGKDDERVGRGDAFRGLGLAKLANFANFWRARSRLYQNEILQENMRLTAFFKIYKMCIFLHRSDFKMSGQTR